MGLKLGIVAVFGVVLLLLGLLWTPLVVPGILEDIETRAGEEAASFGDMPIMEGRLGLMGLLVDLESQGVDNYDFFGVAIDDFDMEWRNVYITSEGIFESGTNKLIIDASEDLTTAGGGAGARDSDTAGETFPSFGVERQDYSIWDGWLNGMTTAHYTGQTDMGGRSAYGYEVSLKDRQFDILAVGSGLGLEEDLNQSEFIADIDFFFDESSKYYLDSETSIPLDIETTLNFSFVFPDMRVLQPYETEHIGTTESAIWVQNENFPNRYDMVEVTVEEYSRIDLLADYDGVALVDEWSVYYYRDTKDPLPDENQGEHRLSAVNRETYKYVAGHGGNQERTGYYVFPMGNPKRQDYPMWDMVADEANTAVYVGDRTHESQAVNVYEMITDNAELEGGNVFVPTSSHPGTRYVYNGIQWWYVEPNSGVMLDYIVRGNVTLESTDPLTTISEDGAVVEFSLSDDFKDTLATVSGLYIDVLLPLQDTRIDAASVQLEYTQKMQDRMIESAGELGNILKLLEMWVPLALIVAGVILIVVPVILGRRKKEDDL